MEIPESKLEAQKKLIRYFTKESEDTIGNLKALCFDSFNAFWMRDGLPLTPEEASELLASLGAVATEIFVKHAAIQGFLKSLDPSWVFLVPPFETEEHPDGSMTLK